VKDQAEWRVRGSRLVAREVWIKMEYALTPRRMTPNAIVIMGKYERLDKAREMSSPRNSETCPSKQKFSAHLK